MPMTRHCKPVFPSLYKNDIYFHYALEWKKIDNIGEISKARVSAVRHTKFAPEKFKTEFESAVAKGICQEVAVYSKKIKALRVLCEKYALLNMGEFDKAIECPLKLAGIYKVSIEQVTGKAEIYK